MEAKGFPKDYEGCITQIRNYEAIGGGLSIDYWGMTPDGDIAQYLFATPEQYQKAYPGREIRVTVF